MGSESQPELHILFFPFMAPGHMNPMIDMAKVFTARGVKSTVLTTPLNAVTITGVAVATVPFPAAAVGLPEGSENFSSITFQDQPLFLRAVSMLRQPFDQIVGDLLPDLVVTDSFLPWTQAVAADHGVLRLVFNGTGFFPLCVLHSLRHHSTLENLPEDAESFVIPGLPHRIEMLRSQIPKISPGFTEILREIRESESRSYGLVVNSFYRLEPEYVDHYRTVVGTRAWHVGPVSLTCAAAREEEDLACLNWLDGQIPGSVVYLCFGSLSDFTTEQLREIAAGLEAAGRPFIWAVKGGGGGDWLAPEKGMVIRGWAPQVPILSHAAVGGFVSHCGWNSTLEGISAGVAMATWPMFAEQFYNERLIVEVLGVGVSVGVKGYALSGEERAVVKAAAVERAVERLMGAGEEAEGRRRRAAKLGEEARRAVEEGGSSYVEIGNLIQELKSYKQAAIEREKRGA